MRVVVVGAGAVGSLFAAHLARAGEAVTLVARPAHGAAVNAGGLRVVERDGATWTASPRAVETIAAAGPGGADVVVLTCKAYDTAAVVADLAVAAPQGVRAVACLQNGVANEPTVRTAFSDVYGVVARFSARLLGPGRVFAAGNRQLAFGRYPRGTDALVEGLVAAARRAGIEATAEPEVAAARWTKLVMNCANAVYAICDVPVSAARTDPTVARLINAVWSEAERVLRAAGVAHEPVAPLPLPEAVGLAGSAGAATAATAATEAANGGPPPYYGSTWDDLARRRGETELPWLNGEIVRLAERAGLPAPANALLLRIGSQMAERREAPGRHTPEALLAMMGDVGERVPA
jgi:2-dehydropantoate 2-reductase